MMVIKDAGLCITAVDMAGKAACTSTMILEDVFPQVLPLPAHDNTLDLSDPE